MYKYLFTAKDVLLIMSHANIPFPVTDVLLRFFVYKTKYAGAITLVKN